MMELRCAGMGGGGMGGGKGGKGGGGGGMMKSARRGCSARSCAAPPMMAAMACAAPPGPPPPPPAPLPAPNKAGAPEPPPPSQKEPQETPTGASGGGGKGGAAGAVDFAKIAAVLDARMEALDGEAALRPTKLKVGETWSKKEHKGLLDTKPSTKSLGADAQTDEKKRAFDLLDALSRAGALPIECAALHVVVAATHCFDTSLMDTVVVKNVNPIEKLEKSSLILAETVQALPAPSLVRPDAYERVSTFSAPMLLPPKGAEEVEEERV